MNSDILNYPYPENLIFAVLGTEVVVDKDISDGLRYILNTLSDRERAVLKYRYVDKYTYEEIGKFIGITRERVRQIENKAFRCLRHPSRSRYLKLGYTIASGELEKALHKKYEAVENNLKDRLDRLAKIVIKLEARENRIKALCGDKYNLIMAEKQEMVREIPTMAHNILFLAAAEQNELPIRCINAIKRAFEYGYQGINRKKEDEITLADIAKLRRKQVAMLRNMGEKSVLDLEKFLSKYNLSLQDA